MSFQGKIERKNKDLKIFTQKKHEIEIFSNKT